MFQLNTNRLSLQEFTPGDAPFIYTLLNTPTWISNIGDRNIRDIPSAENYLLAGPIKSYKENGFGFYKVCLKNHQPVGMCGLVKRPELSFVDIGYAILPEHEGKGYISEAALEVMKYAQQDLKLDKVAGITTIENKGSVQILLKLGMNYIENIRLNSSEKEYMLFMKNFSQE